jgi:hypothetical protein
MWTERSRVIMWAALNLAQEEVPVVGFCEHERCIDERLQYFLVPLPWRQMVHKKTNWYFDQCSFYLCIN